MSSSGDSLDCDVCKPPMLMSEGTNLGNCKSCDRFLEGAAESLRLSMLSVAVTSVPVDDTRRRIAMTLFSKNRTLECLNFCLSSLDRSSTSCSSHESYNPANAINELTRYKKTDLDPSSPPPMNLQPHPHSDLLLTLALAAFLVYGDCTFATECLRHAYQSNPYLYSMISGLGLAMTREEYMHVRHLFHEGHVYNNQYKNTWTKPGVKEWMKSHGEVKRKACNAVGCGKVEEKVGMWRMCNGCSVWYYCGVECQRRDWKEGGHKKACKETKKWVAKMFSELEAATAALLENMVKG